MYKLTLSRDNSILKADKDFKARFKDKKLTNLYTLNGCVLKGELKNDFCFAALLESVEGEACYVMFDCQKFKDITYLTGADVTKEMTEVIKMRGLYVTHPLTGLKNRYVLEEDYAALTQVSQGFLVFRIKIANLEEYILTLGNYFVENLITQAAQMMTNLFGKEDTYHIMENEFLVLKHGGSVYLEGMLRRAVAQFDGILEIEEHNVKLDLKYGVVDFSNEEETKVSFDTLMSISRLAVETASRSSTNTYVLKYFTQHIPTDYSRKGVIASMIKEGAFDVHYQPQLSLKKNQVVCYEALMRIVNSDKKDITTGEMINIAEKYGGILPLGEFIYKRAMDFGKELQDMGSPAGISINASTIQLLERGFASAFLNYMDKIGLESKRVNIEITESAMMYSIDLVLPKLKVFIDAGINIHIDDFGTGYSSLSYLRRLPANAIKIDKSFIDDLTFSSEAEMIVSSIISVAKKLKKLVIAEGVETKSQMEILQKYGCDVLQGYYFSRAVPKEEAISFALPDTQGVS